MIRFRCPICHNYHDYDSKLFEELILECPEKNIKFRTSSIADDLTESVLVNNEYETLVDVGKDIFKNSRTTLRDFSIFMATLSSGAIATYVALIGIIFQKNIAFNVPQSIILSIPALIFLICICFFVCAYIPSTKLLDLNIISSIKEKHESNIEERQYFIAVGIISFISAITSSIVIILTVRYEII